MNDACCPYYCAELHMAASHRMMGSGDFQSTNVTFDDSIGMFGHVVGVGCD
jgi:hypothetical protein